MAMVKKDALNRLIQAVRNISLTQKLSAIACWIIILVVAYSNHYNKFWKDPGRIIAYDVISYYQYLPAIFVHHDLTMKFLEKDPGKYQKKFWANRTETGKYMGRMTMGVAVMYSPFFIVAHSLAGPLGYEADGYSPPYKVALIIASIVYLALGLFLLRHFLKKYYPDPAVALTLLLIGLATNLYFYTVIEPTMSHVFSFFLFGLFLVLLHRWLNKTSRLNALWLGLSAGLIVLVRPSNGIIVVLVLLWEVGSWSDLKHRLTLLLRSWDSILVMALAGLLVLAPQILYWKYVSGHWISYTYGQEGFFFNNPQFIRGMFSYRKGWLVYTPVMALALAGLIVLFYRHRKQFWPVFVFSFINLYIVFSWWSWWYGGGFGQRALIESYAILSLPMTAFIVWTLEKKWAFKVLILLVASGFIFLNIFQTRQYYFGSIHWEGMTKEAYWDSFLRYRPSENFHGLIRYPDNKAALTGRYQDLPVVNTVPQQEDTTRRNEFIRSTIEKMRNDSNWMREIREKAAKWELEVDTVIRRDARWLWEKKFRKDE